MALGQPQEPHLAGSPDVHPWRALWDQDSRYSSGRKDLEQGPDVPWECCGMLSSSRGFPASFAWYHHGNDEPGLPHLPGAPSPSQGSPAFPEIPNFPEIRSSQLPRDPPPSRDPPLPRNCPTLLGRAGIPSPGIQQPEVLWVCSLSPPTPRFPESSHPHPSLFRDLDLCPQVTPSPW